MQFLPFYMARLSDSTSQLNFHPQRITSDFTHQRKTNDLRLVSIDRSAAGNERHPSR